MNIDLIDTPIRFRLYGKSSAVQNNCFGEVGMKLMDAMWKVVKGTGTATTGINHWVYLPDHQMFVGVELLPDTQAPAWLEPLEFELKRYLKHLHIGPYQGLCLPRRSSQDTCLLLVLNYSNAGASDAEPVRFSPDEHAYDYRRLDPRDRSKVQLRVLHLHFLLSITESVGQQVSLDSRQTVGFVSDAARRRFWSLCGSRRQSGRVGAKKCRGRALKRSAARVRHRRLGARTKMVLRRLPFAGWTRKSSDQHIAKRLRHYRVTVRGPEAFTTHYAVIRSICSVR